MMIFGNSGGYAISFAVPVMYAVGSKYLGTVGGLLVALAVFIYIIEKIGINDQAVRL